MGLKDRSSFTAAALALAVLVLATTVSGNGALLQQSFAAPANTVNFAAVDQNNQPFAGVHAGLIRQSDSGVQGQGDTPFALTPVPSGNYNVLFNNFYSPTQTVVFQSASITSTPTGITLGAFTQNLDPSNNNRVASVFAPLIIPDDADPYAITVTATFVVTNITPAGANNNSIVVNAVNQGNTETHGMTVRLFDSQGIALNPPQFGQIPAAAPNTYTFNSLFPGTYRVNYDNCYSPDCTTNFLIQPQIPADVSSTPAGATGGQQWIPLFGAANRITGYYTDVTIPNVSAGTVASVTAHYLVTATAALPTPSIALSNPTITTASTGTLTTVNLGTATAVNFACGPVTITNNAPAGGFPVGTTTVTYTATSLAACGVAPVTASQTVTITGQTPPTGTTTLTVRSVDASGNPITGYWTVITQGTTAIRTGFTPLTATLPNGAYSVGMGNYGAYRWTSWQDNGSTVQPRAITLNGVATTLTGIYTTTSITLTPNSGPAGTTVQVAGIAFTPGAPVTLRFDGTTLATSPATVTTNAAGAFTASFNVPALAGSGPHGVSATTGTGAAMRTASATFAVSTGTPTVSPSLSASPTSALPGTEVALTGANFPANSNVVIRFDTTVIQTVTGAAVTSSASGGFTAKVFVPTSAIPGQHAFSAVAGTPSTTATGANSASDQFTVASPPTPSPTTSTLTVRAQTAAGATLNGMWTVVSRTDGSVIQTGFTPLSVTLPNDDYRIGVGNYGANQFDHWLDNNSTTEPRMISLSGPTTLTAVYRVVP